VKLNYFSPDASSSLSLFNLQAEAFNPVAPSFCAGNFSGTIRFADFMPVAEPAEGAHIQARFRRVD